MPATTWDLMGRIRSVVNPYGEPHTAVYLGGGFDLTSLHQLTDATNALLIGYYSIDRQSFNEWLRRWNRHGPSDGAIRYVVHKAERGYGDSNFIDQAFDQAQYLVIELAYLGIDPNSVQPSEVGGHFSITYSLAGRKRTITFVNVMEYFSPGIADRSGLNYPEFFDHVASIDSIIIKALKKWNVKLASDLQFWARKVKPGKTFFITDDSGISKKSIGPIFPESLQLEEVIVNGAPTDFNDVDQHGRLLVLSRVLSSQVPTSQVAHGASVVAAETFNLKT